MNGFTYMLRNNIKLLLRNKGYLCCIFLIPFLSLCWLLLPIQNNDLMERDETSQVVEIEKDDRLVMQSANTELAIKVYDATYTKMSKQFLKDLSKSGLYKIYRIDARKLSRNEINELVKKSACRTNVVTAVYIPTDFEQKLNMDDSKQTVTIIKTVKDPRVSMLKNDVESQIQMTRNHVKVDYSMKQTTVKTSSGGVLTHDQESKVEYVGYVIAFVSLSFLFSSVFIASIYIKERQNHVLQRINLSKANMCNYILVKVLLLTITNLIQLGVLVVGMVTLVRKDIGINMFQFAFLTFGVGIAFGLISLVVGIYVSNVLNITYIVFFCWCLSNMFAGSLFPIKDSVKWINQLASIMPQKWFRVVYEQYLVGDYSGSLTYVG